MTDRALEPTAAPAPSPEPAAPEPLPLLSPREGVPDVVGTAAGLADVVARFKAGRGAVAVDAERASGFRYGQRAYLVQLRREGAGTALIDPVACPDLSELGEVLSGTEWVLHAASQDLPCLRELNFTPQNLFDTELGGRLAGYPRVGLGPMIEDLLGYHLEKGHSADDWSTRPLPESWLKYAALDVELLVDLREAVHDELESQGKLEWALQEFEAVRTAPPAEPRAEPWRRTSGVHRVRKARNLAVVRALWERRDELARRRDMAPGRVLPDAAIVEAAARLPRTVHELRAVPGFSGRTRSADAVGYFAALEAALALPDRDLPHHPPRSDAPPPAKSWERADPAAAARLAVARPAVTAIADEHHVPTENLLLPDLVRRLCWAPPAELDDDTIAHYLSTGGARPWQVGLTAHVLGAALRRAAAHAV
ncbi:ribonuclease D [Actinospica sp. MGRD01-02]|uniref:Ribonuclease D n=1 Tax=Actinospica acidithermotolerans TaxID=2828514 RepID=A0A941EE10_9ACTN|nr:HRDC domain-containing protein [Actinospica acidithermotolerans]MBR7826069.1 ribonuclease D [Actinospica acidithermotolerans]